MKWWSIAVPLAGTLIAVGVPFARLAEMERHERAAIEVLQRLHAAQQAFRQREGGYATDLSSLTQPCPAAPGTLSANTVMMLAAAGYSLELRGALGATPAGSDCHGRPTTSAYYSAAAPASPAAPARQAFATLSDGRIHLFFDGVAPRESDIARGLATALEARETFRIP